MYKILSLDGGGIMGVLSARILERLKKKSPDFLKDIDLIAGTSTGSIIAMGIALGIDPRKIRLLYESEGPEIFSYRDWWDYVSVDEVTRANYDIDHLKSAVNSYLPDKLLSDLPTRILVPSIDLDGARGGMPNHTRPKFFDSHDEEDRQLSILDVVIRSSAAPTYFASHQGFVDGGLVATNPSDSALALAFKENKEDIRLLSIGAGFSPFVIKDELDKNGEVKSLDWGLSQWATKIIDTVINSSVLASHYKSKQILKDKYHRINSVVDIDIKLDSVDKIDEILDIANSIDLTETEEWIKNNWTIPA